MQVRTSNAEWKGTLEKGSGTMSLASGTYEGPYTFASRFENGPGTNPEELIGAAIAGCYSMFLSALLSNAGFEPTRITTSAAVVLGDGPAITSITLETEGVVPNLTEQVFQDKAEEAKRNCPVSKALAGTEIRLVARFSE
ncbi:OsmC family protein [Syntrophotalea acetylenica]|uniref:Peroxiredoxin n=1 Tax=Syntrophotalea acetylenica TaxID=29542 RepID=A0A1L3GCQ7_SYNAC|nr:OsmC family protein [Syntrophotalea acetylenica]APG23734.1 peroxiredoxin [Syntrophotalea acetylenica]APG44313.1 peroxiredoxin [Syntrophotalea acetylenica]